MWFVPVSWLRMMVRCSRAVGGKWLESTPKAKMMTHWASPSWETTTVPILIPAPLLFHPLTIFVPAPTVFLIADDSPSSEAMASFRKLLQLGVSEGFLQPQFAVKAHRDLGSTECPGDNLYAELLKLKLSPKWERGFDSDWYGEETMQLWMQSVYADFIWEIKNISHCL